MKKTGILMLIVLMMLFGCSANEKEHHGEIKLMNTELPVKAWQMDNSHMTTIHGQVLMDGKPVTHALVAVSTIKTVRTNGDGDFSVLLDQSQPLKVPVHIQSLKEATVSGKPMNKVMQSTLMKEQAELQIAYPIKVHQVNISAADPDQVEIHAQAQLEMKTFFPALMFDRYGWYGIIKDSNGKPVSGAVVELLGDDKSEPLTASEPSGKEGDYLIEAIPQNIQAVSLQVKMDEKTYELQKDVYIPIPHQTSLETDITLQGTMIEGNTDMLQMKLLPGAVYQGIMIGVRSGSPVDYTSTVPTRDGSFILTMPKKVWEEKPFLYETKIRIFRQNPIQAREVIPSEFIPAARNYEPDHIQAQQKSSSK
ncbi:hypothetical protein [Paenibacillus dokdonensis]|uniref:hypothetical protein n=1 Tax=Paenibacillus dokdonensis TaxID=2567944 RepID=UPI0010A7ADB3|nr:hypothetical protein [Paenibacillus dokdonensis]